MENSRERTAAKEVIDLGSYELFTVRKTESTIPLAENVPSGNFPDGAGNIDPFESYAQLFNGETPATINYEFIFMRQNGNADVNTFVRKAFPYSHNGEKRVRAQYDFYDYLKSKSME